MSDVTAALAGLAAQQAGSSHPGPGDHGPHRRYLAVADGILAAVGAGHLSPGDRLPNERDLARICDTSRTTVRDALLALELFGVVEVRPGSGCYISNLTAPRRKTSGVMMDAVPRELIEARINVEPQEALLLSTRVGIMTSGQVSDIFEVPFDHPRDVTAAEFNELRRVIWGRIEAGVRSEREAGAMSGSPGPGSAVPGGADLGGGR